MPRIVPMATSTEWGAEGVNEPPVLLFEFRNNNGGTYLFTPQRNGLVLPVRDSTGATLGTVTLPSNANEVFYEEFALELHLPDEDEDTPPTTTVRLINFSQDPTDSAGTQQGSFISDLNAGLLQSSRAELRIYSVVDNRIIFKLNYELTGVRLSTNESETLPTLIASFSTRDADKPAMRWRTTKEWTRGLYD